MALTALDRNSLGVGSSLPTGAASPHSYIPAWDQASGTRDQSIHGSGTRERDQGEGPVNPRPVNSGTSELRDQGPETSELMDQ